MGARAQDLGLVDRLGRRIEYVRLSVIDRCNMRCFYCRPGDYRAWETRADWLDFDDVERLIGAFAALGVRRVRLTGGEPLLRKGLHRLCARLSAVPGVEDLSLSTNGTLLARKAERLRKVDVKRVNISLDSLRPERFAAITGYRLAPVLEGLEAAKREGIHPIKINMLALIRDQRGRAG